MKTSIARSAATRRVTLVALLVTIICSLATTSEAAVNKKPVLISQLTSTRAIALETITLTAEPFALTQQLPMGSGSDTRTRISVFAMNLELLPGEGVNAFTADVQDATGKLYPLTVEFMGQVPNFPGITMFVLRLHDELGSVGDVLLRLNLHGVASNRVRVAIGQSGGGPADDLGAVPTPAPVNPPPADPPLDPTTWLNAPISDADAVRFLEQTTWGPTTAEIARLKGMGFQAYLNEQFSLPVSNPAKGSNYPDLVFPAEDGSQCPASLPVGDLNVCNRDFFSMYPVQRTFFSNSLYGQDQLRQRVAFALHQILVVSAAPGYRPSWMTVYLQALDRNAFGSYRTLLEDITLNPSMGDYLDMRLSTRTNPNENWAREVLQLFSIGTAVLNSDGSPQLDSQGIPVASYSQTTVNEFTKVFTGWNFVPGAIAPGTANWRDPMVPRFSNSSAQHDTGARMLFTTPVAGCPGTLGTANQTCAQNELTIALNVIFNHPNVGPFISKQLIQHLVTSNPSRAYVQRVASVFNDDCSGLYPSLGCTHARGNLKAVVQAILLDPEARGDVKTDPNYGKLREPAQYINGFLRAFNVKSFDKSSTSDGVLSGRSTTDFTGTLDQPIFFPPTVFSYYQPDYEVPGTKILGPAFGILSTSTTLRRANDVNTLVYTGVAPNTTPTAASPDRPRGTSIDLANLEALAGNPGDAVDALNTLLLHGTMSTQMRNSIIAAMNTINDATITTRNQKRARMAVYLVATSSQYDIQR